MNKMLLIIFVKNIVPGKVKTRLAKDIGDDVAFKVYKHLVDITEKITSKIEVEKRIYFSDDVIENKWSDQVKLIQKGESLGERMKNAFLDGFNDGYEKVVLIGSDLPDLSVEILEESFYQLSKTEVVFGPAEDGGYYLVGLTKPHFAVFENKTWSTNDLLEITLKELDQKQIEYTLLTSLNDIDTIDDLTKSSIRDQFKEDFNSYIVEK